MTQRQLGVFIPQMDDNCQRIMRGVVRYLRERGGWEMVTQEATPWMTWDDLGRFRADGIIAVVYSLDQYRRLRRRRTPCVNVCARYETPGLPSVYSDNPEIGRLGAATLWQTGVRHFAFVGRPNFYHDRARGEGFRESLRAHGIECELIDVAPLIDRPHDLVDARKIVARLRRLPRPVGIFAAHDHLGCQVLSACRREGIRVPHEAAVLGVNDFTLLCETAQPPLSSIRQQAERTSYEAAQLLTEIVEGTAEPTTRILLPPGEVIERQSTDTLAVEDAEVCRAILFIRSHMAEPITVNDVAHHVSMSRRGLDKRFLATIGHTAAVELWKARLRRGQQLLSQTNLGVTEVSARCGFSTVSSFDRAFRDTTGMTPRQYRKQHGIEA